MPPSIFRLVLDYRIGTAPACFRPVILARLFHSTSYTQVPLTCSECKVCPLLWHLWYLKPAPSPRVKALDDDFSKFFLEGVKASLHSCSLTGRPSHPPPHKLPCGG